MSDLASRVRALTGRRTIAGNELAGMAADILARCGLSDADARKAADALADAQLRGSQSHGVMHLPAYVRGILKGTINAVPRLAVAAGKDGTAVIDADNCLGVLAGIFAVDHLVTPARRFGIAAAAVRNSNHFGVGGYFVERTVRQGLIGLAFSNAAPTMAPFGGRQAVLGTNPIAAAFPLRDDAPIVLDMSTSIVARARIRQAARDGRPIPPDWSLDASGRPTTDANAALEGTIQPMGGAKGYGLALLAELLSSSLSDGTPGFAVANPHEPAGRPAGVSHFFVLIDPDGFCGRAQQAARAQALAARIRQTTGVDGRTAPRLPGERGHAARRQALQDGIPLTPGLLAALTAAVDLLDGQAREASQ